MLCICTQLVNKRYIGESPKEEVVLGGYLLKVFDVVGDGDCGFRLVEIFEISSLFYLALVPENHHLADVLHIFCIVNIASGKSESVLNISYVF